MKLVAAQIVKNEFSRYLERSMASLLRFCDEVRVIDDFSTDGTYEFLQSLDRVHVLTNPALTFDAHEGKARQALLDWVREAEPTHVLAIDADEFCDDGARLRTKLETDTDVDIWLLEMEEVWKADERSLWTRQDGGWKSHGVAVAWRAPSVSEDRWWRIRDKQLACGREPIAVSERRATAHHSGCSILHFGWTNESERQRRYDRYMSIDGGAFHASTHLRSIMHRTPRLRRRVWPYDMERSPMLAEIRKNKS